MSPEYLEKIVFTVFDTETTGLDPLTGDRIVEIAGVKVQADTIIDSFTSLVDPERPVSPAARSVHGISDEELHQAPPLQEVLPRFLSFSAGTRLCSYNAPFDLSFLKVSLDRIGQSVASTEAVDVLRMARRLIPGIPSYALGNVARHLGLEHSRLHRALADVHLTWQVFRRLTPVLKQQAINDMETFSTLFAVRC